MLAAVILLTFLTSSLATHRNSYTFPEHVIIGAGSSAYQIEGAWNVDGKGPNIWDTYVHEHPDGIDDHSNADDAAKSYYKYKDDIQAVKYMGMKFYRFSVSWPRILPTGLPTQINRKGVEYYNNVINECLRNGITPMITMHHFDLPNYLLQLGGWTNEILIEYFEAYSKVLFEEFGDRVKWWTTFNEPIFMVNQYEDLFGPGFNTSGIGPYLAAHTIVKSHARAYHLYDKHYRRHQGGKMSITLSIIWASPLNKSSEADIAAADRNLQFNAGWFAHPIFSPRGDYPEVIKERIAKLSKEEGYQYSRLPKFTREEIKYIRGTADFFGLNQYFTNLATPGESGPVPSYNRDEGVTRSVPPSWPRSNTSTWLTLTPAGIRKTMNWIVDSYGKHWEILITENGYGDDGEMNDTDRINYLATYMAEVLKAMYEDNIKVIGYLVWSLIDGWEWVNGYTTGFGLFHVDFKDPDRKRTPRKSADFMREITKTRTIPSKYVELGNRLNAMEKL